MGNITALQGMSNKPNDNACDISAKVWSFVDAANDDIHIPKNNSFLDIIYKFINSIINLFKR